MPSEADPMLSPTQVAGLEMLYERARHGEWLNAGRHAVRWQTMRALRQLGFAHTRSVSRWGREWKEGQITPQGVAWLERHRPE
jgi:hypothetical protein